MLVSLGYRVEVRGGGGLLGGDGGRYRAVAREFGVPSLHRLGNQASDNRSLELWLRGLAVPRQVEAWSDLDRCFDG